MNLPFGDRLKHAWNAFNNKDPTQPYTHGGDYSRPDRPRLTRGNERSLMNSIYSRIALDAAVIDIKHVRVDEDDAFVSTIDSGLNNCLSTEANADQTGRAFMQDVVLSMLDEGVVAILPVDTSLNPARTGSYDILSVRTGKILQWFPKDIQVRVYDENTGKKQDLIVPKKIAAIIENPFFSVMNEPNSTMKRLTHKISQLDDIDERTSSGKLDLIIQLPYLIKTEAKRKQAEKRRKEVEEQLTGSNYGIAYTDGTERVIQLNRAVENNLTSQVEYLTNLAFSQLGMTQSILDGTADEKTMTNYYNRTIEPIVAAITDEMKRKFLTKTARSQHQSIMYFRDPFKLITISDLAEIADKLTRNEIMSSNEFRPKIGMKPSKDPKADELRNKNINRPDDTSQDQKTEEIQNGI